ncbi:hypothetical protein TCDM_04074 [Trypanosoma cruzi Dm28c]|uniref:Gamma-soluble NSF attachment protein n=2 Tax=Trypanosoma cruzi TaxID=5693 RepID=V5BRU6_TRYCR|nr:hypothetical protein TCDM_04074 [Trypanosoma cruzi Dm28c]PBJ72526.1 hypothetical protein BCY84_15377 [Trypanosoma cruzi cruzi]PWU90897.1 hypothetical protein C4B63_47g80 [Trypanosoma cruzi]
MAAGSAEEAFALMKSAEKHSQKKFFKRPDWDTAASEYERAARIYTYLEDTNRATDAWRKASGAHQNGENNFFAARAMESLAVFLTEQSGKGMADDTSLLNNAVEAYCDASKLYAFNEMFDRQADCLKKAAQIINPTKAIVTGLPATEAGSSQVKKRMQQVVGLFREGVSVLEEHIEDKPVVAVQLPELYRNWMLTHLHNGDVKGAVEVLEEQLGIRADPHKKGVFEWLAQPHNSAKAGLEIIVLCLSCGDDVWARQEMNKLRGVPGFSTSKEEATANALISSFEERDEEQLRAAMKNQTLQFITIDISRMSRKLKIQFSAPQRTNMTSSSLPNPSLPNEQQQGEEQQEADIDPEEDIR